MQIDVASNRNLVWLDNYIREAWRGASVFYANFKCRLRHSKFPNPLLVWFNCSLKVYIFKKMMTFENLISEAQCKNFLFHGKVYFFISCFVFEIFDYLHFQPFMMSITTRVRVYVWVYLLNDFFCHESRPAN